MKKIAVVTPTNNPLYLISCYRSLLEQTYKAWTWTVVSNNMPDDHDTQANWLAFLDKVSGDNRVKIVNAVCNDPEKSQNIGRIKHDAFMAAIRLWNPQVVVELDHDDLLMPTAIGEINKAFTENANAGFVYSDCVRFGTTPPEAFGAAYGWVNQKRGEIKVRDYEHEESVYPCIYIPSFEPSAHSMRYIWYAPDHLRAWSADLYQELGGHNSDFSVCDDHELLIRTYLSAKKMIRIPKPLYLYRCHNDNTVIHRNQKIQQTTVELHHKYLPQLAEKWADDHGLMKVDIGGGIFAKEGYTTIDLRDTADIQADLDYGIPLEDNSVGVLNASHIIEHLKDPCQTMREIHRVLAPNGFAFIEVPSTDGRGAWQDPTHVSFWNENSFWYYTRKTQSQFIDHVEGMKDVRFMEDRLDTVWWDNQIAVTHAWLIALKPDSPRVPGEIKI